MHDDTERMDQTTEPADPALLMAIIQAQTEVAQLGLDLGAVMDFVTSRVQTLTGAAGAIVELAEGEEMVYRAASGIAERQLGLRLSRQGSLSGESVALGQILCCQDSESDERVDRDACRRVGLRSMIVSPLIHAGHAVGVLKIAWQAPAAFSHRDVRLVELMSGLIAASMYTASRFEADELYRRATQDPLTGLANRALFYDRLRQCLSLAERKAAQVGVINLDMDGLKPINDRFGHRAGDAAIRETALRIRQSVRTSDTTARLGGDEFGVILSQVEDRHTAAECAERIRTEIERPFTFEERPLPLNASVGVAVFPEDANDLDGLIERADKSMYAMKRTRSPRRV